MDYRPTVKVLVFDGDDKNNQMTGNFVQPVPDGV